MSRVRLLFGESLRSLGANLSTTIAATMTVLIGMFLLGLFIALGSWVVSWSDHVKRGLEVKVFFDQGVTDKQVSAVQVRLEQDPRIKPGGVVFISEAEALTEMKKKYPELTQDLPSNPLPASFRITPKRGEDVPAIGEELQHAKLAGVYEVKMGQEDLGADPQGRASDRGHLPGGGGGAPCRLDPADREHDPALDLLPAT